MYRFACPVRPCICWPVTPHRRSLTTRCLTRTVAATPTRSGSGPTTLSRTTATTSTTTRGIAGGLAAGAKFVIVGDQNADPQDGDSLPGAMDPLLGSARIQQATPPSSAGGVEDSALEGGINRTHLGNPAFDTADFGASPGNLRVDYLLPSVDLEIVGGGVYWPTRDDPLAPLLSVSDHRLVYVDLVVPEPATGVLLTIAFVVLGGSRRARGRHRPSSS